MRIYVRHSNLLRFVKRFRMKFRTCIQTDEIQKPAAKIDYQSKIGLIGSCFVENISEKLSYFRFKNWINPHGILFNPKAIEKALVDIKQQKIYARKDLVFENELWHSWHHHSDFSSNTASETIANISKHIQQTTTEIKETTHLILTLGTAWVYHHIETDQLVANCHKIPQKFFVKKILSIDEIVASLRNSIALIKKMNPHIQILLTLSPVRHLKDGMLDNSLSKARLLSAIHQVVSESDASYFPSYEIVLDDLRDYRFYASDMMHPNQTAIDYVWDIFKEVWVASDVFSAMEKVAQIQKGLQHRAFNPNSDKHQQFLKKLVKQQENLFNNYKITF